LNYRSAAKKEGAAVGNYKIVKCKECGRLFRLNYHTIKQGDPGYCKECNKKSGRERPSNERWE